MIRCEDCRFFEPIRDCLEGICHRFPRFERHGAMEWCGEAEQLFKVDLAKIAKDEAEFYGGFYDEREA